MADFGYTLYLALHVMIAFAAAQVFGHYAIWFFKAPRAELRPVWAALSILSLWALVWVISLMVTGMSHRSLSRGLACMEDVIALCGFWTALAAAWDIDFRFTYFRMTRCVIAEILLAIGVAAFARVVWGW